MTVDLASYSFHPACEVCDKPATVLAKGCMDKQSAALCDSCLKRGLEVVGNAVKLYQRLNKKVLICGDCHRPILTLETHVEITEI